MAIGRGLMSNPRLLLLDEVSLGLAPIVVQELYRAMPAIVEAGTTLLLVEQDIGQAVAVADYVTCLLEGRLVLEGRSGEITREEISAAYFGSVTQWSGSTTSSKVSFSGGCMLSSPPGSP